MASGRKPSATWSSMNGTIASSSSRSRSSGDGGARPIASRMTMSSSSGNPVRSLTCRNVSSATPRTARSWRHRGSRATGHRAGWRRPPLRARSQHPRAIWQAARGARRQARSGPAPRGRGCRDRPVERGRKGRPRPARQRRGVSARSRSAAYLRLRSSLATAPSLLARARRCAPGAPVARERVHLVACFPHAT